MRAYTHIDVHTWKFHKLLQFDFKSHSRELLAGWRLFCWRILARIVRFLVICYCRLFHIFIRLSAALLTVYDFVRLLWVLFQCSRSIAVVVQPICKPLLNEPLHRVFVYVYFTFLLCLRLLLSLLSIGEGGGDVSMAEWIDSKRPPRHFSSTHIIVDVCILSTYNQ